MASIFDVRVDFDAKTLMERLGMEPGGRVQQAIDKAVIDYDHEYVPWKTGTLGKSPYSVTQAGSGQVVYPGPYARYLYYGEVMGPNIPIFGDGKEAEPTGFFSPPGEAKQLTGRALQYDTSHNPLAGAFWFERMKADHLSDILKEAKDAATVS